MSELVPLLQQRPQVVVQDLNAIDGGIGDIPGSKALEPVVFDLSVRGDRHVSEAFPLGSGGSEKLIGLLEKRHGAILGKSFPNCQGALSPNFGKRFLMPHNLLTPRQVLAKNLTAVVKKFGGTNRSIAAKTGGAVDAKTVSNQMNARFDSRLEQVDAVAKVFGLRYWDLINPLFDVDAPPGADMMRIAEIYASTTDQGRDSIRSVAVLAEGLKVTAPPPPAPEQPAAIPARRRGAARR